MSVIGIKDGICDPYLTTPENCSFISTAMSTVHNNPSRKRVFRKRSSTWRNLKTLVLCFIVDRKASNFKTELFENDDITILGGLPDRVLLQIHILQLPAIVAFLNFSCLGGPKAFAACSDGEDADFKVLGRGVYKALCYSRRQCSLETADTARPFSPC